jgi:hypothetical protein
MIPAPLHWSWHRHPEYPGKHWHEPSGRHVPMSHGLHGTEQSSPAYPSPPNTFSTDESHAHVPLTVAVEKTQLAVSSYSHTKIKRNYKYKYKHKYK